MYYPMNAITISLISKVDALIEMKDFRPISYCIVTYKVVTWILENRIKPFLAHLVDQNQSVFVHGRNIQHNILLIHDLMKIYKKATDPIGCAIKMGIMKAFDTVN